MTFKQLSIGQQFDFDHSKLKFWSGAIGPWIKTGPKNYRHASDERGFRHKIGSINAKVIPNLVKNPVHRKRKAFRRTIKSMLPRRTIHRAFRFKVGSYIIQINNRNHGVIYFSDPYVWKQSFRVTASDVLVDNPELIPFAFRQAIFRKIVYETSKLKQ